jgi:carboxymethylenebutenolidase
MGETTRFGGGRNTGTGYLARSEPVGPCVLVLHEFFGMTPSFIRYAEKLREQRFTVLVPDLYDGVVAGTVEEAKALAGSLDGERTVASLVEAVEHMRMNWHPRVGAIGFSLGAYLATELAQATQLDAVALYYGFSEIHESRWDAPLLVHAAEHDEWDSLEDLRAALSPVPDAELHVYPGTGHWFANEDVPDAFALEASSLAFERTVGFLTHHLS